MSITLQSFLNGQWQQGEGVESELRDPVNGELLATASTRGLDMAAAVDHARTKGGPALGELSYVDRAKILGQIADLLLAQRARYVDIAISNSGNTRSDAAIDIDGGIGTLKYYARLGAGLGNTRALIDQAPIRLAKAENYQALHVLVPRRGIAVHVNAFNFPSWGLWEKAAVALLSGVPVIAKPSAQTALLAYQMARDVDAAKLLPEGALNLICGGVGNLLSLLTSDDVISFTGSSHTGRLFRSHRNIIELNIPLNIEADSVNAAILAPDGSRDSVAFDAFIRESLREITTKAGQKCTAIRRIFVPSSHAAAATEALTERQAKVVVGDPRRDDVQMGPVVTRSQQASVRSGIAQLTTEAELLCGGSEPPMLSGIDAGKSAFVRPTLLRARNALSAKAIHDVEVFGPVATLMTYDNEEQLHTLVRRGGGSLVASIFSNDVELLARATRELGAGHGRILAIDPSIANSHTGHGIVMPQCNHGGPGRAGNGEELGGLHGLRFYHQRLAVQGSNDLLPRIQAEAASIH